MMLEDAGTTDLATAAAMQVIDEAIETIATLTAERDRARDLAAHLEEAARAKNCPVCNVRLTVCDCEAQVAAQDAVIEAALKWVENLGYSRGVAQVSFHEASRLRDILLPPTPEQRENLRFAVAQAYTEEGVRLWWESHRKADPKRRARMEAGVLAAYTPPAPEPEPAVSVIDPFTDIDPEPVAVNDTPEPEPAALWERDRSRPYAGQQEEASAATGIPLKPEPEPAAEVAGKFRGFMAAPWRHSHVPTAGTDPEEGS